MKTCAGPQASQILIDLIIGELVKEKNGEKILKCIETQQLYQMAKPV